MRLTLPAAPELARLGAGVLGGALGLLGGAAGAGDAPTLLAWLALSAPALGALCAARGPALFPFGLMVPTAWAGLLLLANASGHGPARELATPLWAACALGGLFALGWALGGRSAAPVHTAGLLLLAALALSGAALGFGVLVGGAELAPRHPGAARWLVELSPLVLVQECAGRDWTHAQPEFYARSGVEWFQRRPYAGNLAGPVVLVVGCALAWLARAFRPAPRVR